MLKYLNKARFTGSLKLIPKTYDIMYVESNDALSRCYGDRRAWVKEALLCGSVGRTAKNVWELREEVVTALLYRKNLC